MALGTAADANRLGTHARQDRILGQLVEGLMWGGQWQATFAYIALIWFETVIRVLWLGFARLS